MAYLFPYVGDERRRPRPAAPKPVQAAKPQVHIPPAPVVVIEPVMPRVETHGMTMQMRKIAEEVCERHKVNLAEMISPSRTMKIIRARREYIFRCRSQLGKSFPQIANSLNQDHTTAISAYYKAAENPKSMTPYKRPIPPSSGPVDQIVKTDLSPNQKMVYNLMMQGMSNQEIADATGKTKSQAKNARYDVNRKLKKLAMMENK